MQLMNSIVPAYTVNKTHSQETVKSLTRQGISVFVSDSSVGSYLEASDAGTSVVTTRLTEDSCKLIHTGLTTLVKWATKRKETWKTLSQEKRLTLLRSFNMPESNCEVGWLHDLVVKHELPAPKGYTVHFTCESEDRLFKKKACTWTVIFHLLPLTSRLSQRMWKPRSLRISIVQEALSSDNTRSRWTLQLRGSALELLQGHANYAVPSSLPELGEGARDYELELFEHSLRLPFNYLSDILAGVVKANLSLRQTSYKMSQAEFTDKGKSLCRRLKALPPDVISVHNLTLTQYIPENYLTALGMSTQQFLLSLRTIYSVTKSNWAEFLDQGMTSYKGITGTDVLVNENQREQQLAVGTNPSDIYSVTLRRSNFANTFKGGRIVTRSIHHLNSVQFSLTKTRGLSQLGMSKEAKLALEKCLRIRVTLFNKYLRDNRIDTLQDLLRFMQVDHGVYAFRAQVQKQLSSILESYDYVYWWYNRYRWSRVLSVDNRKLLLRKLKESDTPQKICEVLALWLDPSSWIQTDPDLIKPVFLYMKVFHPEDYATAVRHNLSPATLRKHGATANKLRERIRAKLGIDILYPLYFHQSMYVSILLSQKGFNLESSKGKALLRQIYNGEEVVPFDKEAGQVGWLSTVDKSLALAFGLKPALKKLHIL